MPDGRDVEPYGNRNVRPCKKMARLMANHRSAPGSFHPQPQARSARGLRAVCAAHVLACGYGLNEDGARCRKNEADDDCSGTRHLSDQRP